MANEDVIKEMPEYHAHKPVRACPIVDVNEDQDTPGEFILNVRMPDASLRDLIVDADWMDKYAPLAGNYVVVGADGQLAYSAARDFEPSFVDAAQEVVKEGKTVFSREHEFRKGRDGSPVLASTLAADRLDELEPWTVPEKVAEAEPVEPAGDIRPR